MSVHADKLARGEITPAPGNRRTGSVPAAARELVVPAREEAAGQGEELRDSGFVGTDRAAAVESPAALEVAATVDVDEMAQVRLQHSPYRAIRRVGCTFSNGVLTLTGAVPTFHYKQLAQTAVLGIAGVRQVVNLIDVG